MRLEIGQYGRVDFVLTTGEIAETLTVTGQSPIINTEKAEIGSVIEEKKIRDLPLRGRDITKLAFLTTGGTQETQDVGLIDPGLRLRRRHAGLQRHVLAQQPGPARRLEQHGVHQRPHDRDARRRRRSRSSSWSPTTTRRSTAGSGGAVISMASKSGTNEFHGDAWYYFRNESLDANRFFNNRIGRGKLPVDYQIFGGAFGGPIFKNKTFFYGNYEHFIDDLSADRLSRRCRR